MTHSTDMRQCPQQAERGSQPWQSGETGRLGTGGGARTWYTHSQLHPGSMSPLSFFFRLAGLTSQMREQAAAARPVGASLAAAANAYQERLRKVTRGMMATISELSLYQVRALPHVG